MRLRNLLNRSPKTCKCCGSPGTGEHELYCKRVVELAHSKLPTGSHLTLDDMALALHTAHSVGVPSQES